MERSKKFMNIGAGIFITIIVYSIILYVILQNTISGGGPGHLNMAQVAFMYNLFYIIPIGLVGIGLIYKGNKLRKIFE
ncbi:MAG: hypothetical protein ACFFDN_23885 [Candidatus Hodarchaeota archaeon]